MRGFKLEEGHELLQVIGLAAELLGGGGQLFGGRCVLLGSLVELPHCPANL